MDKPLFSIIMPVFHRNKEVSDIAKDCYASVKNHSKDYEYIIVDNGSSEDTSFFKGDVNVRFKENRGIAPAWNAGLKLAKADYLVVINDDIIVQSGWLNKLKIAADMPEAGVANTHVEHLPHGIGVVENYKWFSGSCFMMKRETLEKVGFFDERYFPCNWEDWDYWLRVYQTGLKLYVNYTMSIQHREGQTVHDKDLSSQFLTNKQRFIDKWGFDATQVFCGNMSMGEALAQIKPST